MRENLKQIINEGSKLGFSDLKIICCEVKKNISSLEEQIICNCTYCEKWIQLVGVKNGVKRELNCSLDESMSPRDYISLLEGKEVNFYNHCLEKTIEKDLVIVELALNECLKNINQYIKTISLEGSHDNNMWDITSAKYTNFIKNMYYYDSNNLYRSYVLAESEFDCLFLQPNPININIKGNSYDDILNYIVSDYIKYTFNITKNFTDTLSGKIKLGIMAMYQICRTLLFHFNSEAVINGASIFSVKDFIDKKNILSNKINIWDIPQDEKFNNQYLFDDEGSFTEPKLLIKEGRLNECLGSIKTAQYYDFVNKGNCYRNSDIIEYQSCYPSNIQMILDDKSDEINTVIEVDGEIVGFQGDVYISSKMELLGNAIFVKTGEYGSQLCTINIPLNKLFEDCYSISPQKKFLNLSTPEIIIRL